MNDLAVVSQNVGLSLLMDPVRFDHLQRVGKMLALSPLFPEHLRKGGLEAAVANGALVLNMAHRLNEDPLTVAQNIYFVGGRPGWNTTYMIGKANQAGVFRDPIDWEITGEGESLSVTAFGILARTGKRVEVTLDWEVAKKEGWTKNPKYQSIPEQMFRYRTAAFLIRLYCPEVMIGLPTQIEQELEMRDITPGGDAGEVIVANTEAPIEAKASPQKSTAARAETAKAVQDAETVSTAKADDPAPTKEPEPETAEREDRDAGGHMDRTPDESQFRGLLEMMLADLAQSGPDDCEETYGPQIDQMRQSAPACYREWQDALTAARSR